MIDAREMRESTERFFKNLEYHTKRIEELVKKWKKEDEALGIE